MKLWDALGALICRNPIGVAALWLIAAGLVGVLSPSLTELAAEGQARMLSSGQESRHAAALVRSYWPDQAYESMAVAMLHREGGLKDADRSYAAALQERFESPDRPREIARVLGPGSAPEIHERLVSRDGTAELVAVPLLSSFVAPVSQDAVAWLQRQPRELARAGGPALPVGLEVRWAGDAVVGRDFMANVQTTLDRAAVSTVIFLMIVLLFVYRSFWLALVPLVTIGVSIVIARGALAWLMLAGWEVSSLVELFLIAILFGTGTDFCLFLSWRYAEHLNRNNPVGSMRATLGRSFIALATSGGTTSVGLLLMGTTRFKLFSSTGPSVALGLMLALLATLSLTPALLVLLARFHPSSFDGLAHASTELWDRLGASAMAHPLRRWMFTVLAMLPLSLLALRTEFIQDMLTELPSHSRAVEDFRRVASKFDPGLLAPLTIVLESDTDFRTSEGLALIDDVSHLLSHQRELDEVRSATQPLGSPQPLSRARLAARLGEVNQGFHSLSKGAEELSKGLTEGAAKLRAAIWLEEATGLPLTGAAARPLVSPSGPTTTTVAAAPAPPAALPGATRKNVASSLKKASAVLQWSQGMPMAWNLPALGMAFEAFGKDEASRPKKPAAGGAKPRPNADANGPRPGAPSSGPPPGNATPSSKAAPLDPAARPATGRSTIEGGPRPAAGEKPKPHDEPKPNDERKPGAEPKPHETVVEGPREVLLRELTRAAGGAMEIADGARRAHAEVTEILNDPVGRRALDRLLIDERTVREHPELLKSFAAYITPDGRRARLDVAQADRIFSNDAMNQVLQLRRRLRDFLGEYENISVTAQIAGANAESADIRDLTRSDQVQSWFIVPIGVFFVLLVALRDPLACFNLVATMILTYLFALGTTHLVFVTVLGAEGLDWKVPYFLFVLLVAVGVDYNVFLMTRLNEESQKRGLRRGIVRAIGQTGGLISSAAAITASSFASFMFSPLGSLRQLGFALVVGILIDATLVRPLLVPCGHWLLMRTREALAPRIVVRKGRREYAVVPD